MHCAVMGGLSVHALRCALLLVSLVFGELFFGESPSLHDLFLHFLAKCTKLRTVWTITYTKLRTVWTITKDRLLL